MDVTIRPVTDEDAGELLTLRRAAFVTEAQVYGDPNIPPLTQTLEELRADLAAEGIVTLGAWRADAAGWAGRSGRYGIASHVADARRQRALLAVSEELHRRAVTAPLPS